MLKELAGASLDELSDESSRKLIGLVSQSASLSRVPNALANEIQAELERKKAANATAWEKAQNYLGKGANATLAAVKKLWTAEWTAPWQWMWPTLFKGGQQQSAPQPPSQRHSIPLQVDAHSAPPHGYAAPHSYAYPRVDSGSAPPTPPRTFRHGDDEDHIYDAAHRRAHRHDYQPLHHGHHHSPEELRHRRQLEYEQRMARDELLWQQERRAHEKEQRGQEPYQQQWEERMRQLGRREERHEPEPASMLDSVWRHASLYGQQILDSADQLKQRMWPTERPRREPRQQWQQGEHEQAQRSAGQEETDWSESGHSHTHPPHHAAEHWTHEYMHTHGHQY